MTIATESLSALSIRSLLLLRLALNDERDNTDIRQDVQDLYLFPERLTDSYPDEWRAYIRRRLVTVKLDIGELSRFKEGGPVFQGSGDELQRLVTLARPAYEKLVKVLEEAEISSHTDNVRALKTPLHKWLEWAVS